MGILMWVEEMVKIIFGIKLLDAKKSINNLSLFLIEAVF